LRCILRVFLLLSHAFGGGGELRLGLSLAVAIRLVVHVLCLLNAAPCEGVWRVEGGGGGDLRVVVW
jgi:hypothetical protein